MRLTGYSVFLAVMSLVACMSCFWAGFADFGESSVGSVLVGVLQGVVYVERRLHQEVTSTMGASIGKCVCVCVCVCVWWWIGLLSMN